MTDLIVSPKSVKNVRRENQDVFGRCETRYGELFILADGMGGASGGYEAADLTVSRFPDHLEKAYYAQLSPGDALAYAARGVNRDVFVMARKAYRRMGSTLVAALRTIDGFLIVHMGDSRAYFFSREGLIRLTRDHSAVQVWMDEGRLTPKEAREHPRRGLLTRAVGVNESCEPELYTRPIVPGPGEGLLLCSDGLCGFAEDIDIQQTLAMTADKRRAADALIELALKSGSDDNITIVYIHNPSLLSTQNDQMRQQARLSSEARVSGSTRLHRLLPTKPVEEKGFSVRQWIPLILVLLIGGLFSYFHFSRGLSIEDTPASLIATEAFQPAEVESADDFNWEAEVCPASFAEKARAMPGGFEPAMREAMVIPSEEETALAKEYAAAAETMFGGNLDNDPEWTTYLTQLGNHLLKYTERPGLTYTFHYVDDAAHKAFALPGGHIYVFRGLLDTYIENEAQLIFVLAREIRHVDGRHALAFDRMLRQHASLSGDLGEMLRCFAGRPFSVTREKEADRTALQVMVSEGYSPFQAYALIKALSLDAPEELPENPTVDTLPDADRIPAAYPSYISRACALKNQTVGMLPTFEHKTFYVGAGNYERKLPSWVELF
ncbi:MAG: protein phosphatase 2C domain-containing protein [Acidobacteriota bacterium]|nr:protein phosphatase 2C domain-containing protein [Acidobacteriota bacterium]